jgi:hypothetical protein
MNQNKTIEDQLRADRDRWRRAAEILADSISLAQRGDFEGTVEILEQVYEEANRD